MITDSMQNYYREDNALEVDLVELRAKEISYPNSGPLCTIGDLMTHPKNAFAFLLRLTGETGPKIQRLHSSPFFSVWSTGDISCTRPRLVLNNMIVDIILPYAVTLPLALGARAVTNRAEREKNKAAQYLLEPLVFNRTTRHLSSLFQMQGTDPQGRATKKMRTTRSPYDVSTEDVVKFTPYSASYAARSKKHNEAAGTHLFHTAFTFDELYKSHGKRPHFTDGFMILFSLVTVFSVCFQACRHIHNIRHNQRHRQNHYRRDHYSHHRDQSHHKYREHHNNHYQHHHDRLCHNNDCDRHESHHSHHHNHVNVYCCLGRACVSLVMVPHRGHNFLLLVVVDCSVSAPAKVAAFRMTCSSCVCMYHSSDARCFLSETTTNVMQ